MAGNRNDWFPTPIWMFRVNDCQALNQQLLQVIYEDYSQDIKGKELSNTLGWHSANSLEWQETFNNFIQIVTENVMEAATFLNWDFNKFAIHMTDCWALINNQYASNSLQNYPNSVLSGIYYVKAPLNSGGLFFPTLDQPHKF